MFSSRISMRDVRDAIHGTGGIGLQEAGGSHLRVQTPEQMLLRARLFIV
jgi:hypothetical protein